MVRPIMAGPRRSRRSERGVILFAALLALSLLSLMAAGLIAVSRGDRLLARNALEATRAELADETAIAHAIAALAARDPADPWPIDGTPRILEIDGLQVTVAIQDELGKIDINQASEQLLSDLFAALGVARQPALALADAIADWRDADDAKRLNGAEAADYRAAGRGYGPRDAPFETLEELRLVLGMTPEIFANARPHLTVYSQRAQVNAQTASPAVRAALAGVSQMPRTTSAPATTSQLANLSGLAFSISATAKGRMNTTLSRRTTVRFMGGPSKPSVVLE